MHEPKTLQEAIAYFSDPERTFQYAVKLRFPSGEIYCPRCGAERFSFIKTRRIWFCYACKKQFTVKVKTIMEDSARALIRDACDLDAGELQERHFLSRTGRGLLASPKSRHGLCFSGFARALQERSFGGTKIGGSGNTVEADETFVGGKASNMHSGKRKAQEAGPVDEQDHRSRHVRPRTA